MEVAGVALGGIPLILIALEKYAKVAKILKDYGNYEATLDRLKLGLWIQEEQYDDTMETIGLKDLSLDDVEIHLRQRHPYKCDKFMGIVRRMNVIAKAIADMLDVESPTKLKWGQEGEKRFKTEMKRMFLSLNLEDGELNQLFGELSALNNALKNCFAKMEVPLADTVDNRAVRRLYACFDADRCIIANQNARVLHGALQAGWGCSCSLPHKGSVRLNWHTEKWLAPEKFEMALSYGSTLSEASEELWRQVTMKIEPKAPVLVPIPEIPDSAVPGKSGLREGLSKTLKRVRIQDPATNSSTTSVKTQAVPPSTSSAVTSPLAISDHITVLCTVLRDCVNDGLGYLLHPDPIYKQHVRVHSTLAKPPAVVNSQALIGQTKKARLTRKRRFEIAASVCWAVLLLADTDWLSEDLTKDEVQLMTEVCKPHSGNDFEDTYVSCAFKGTQANVNSSHSATSTSKSFIRNRTLFALGILLMELCLNRAFSTLRDQLQGSTSSPGSGASVDEDIDECLEEVYYEAGDESGYAVQRCLRCEFPGPDRQKNFQHPPFRTHFFRGVVAPVQATFETTSNPTVTV